VALFDLTLPELREYRPEAEVPPDLVDFWRATFTETAEFPLAATFDPVDAALPNVDVHDVRFAGFGAAPIAAWLVTPRDGRDSAPCVVQYLGYGMGRGLPHDHTVWAAAGWATLVMDTRGTSGRWGVPGDTPDPGAGSAPHVPGFLTQGLDDPAGYYYRRVFTDAVRALSAAAVAPKVDPTRLVVAGASQGGAITQAVAALHGIADAPTPLAALIDVPFLTHIRRAVDLTDEDPYHELVAYLSTRRTDVEVAFRTLSYFDGLSLAALGTVPALYSVALRDPICPPSTVFAAYNTWAGPKRIEVWPFNEHEGGGTFQLGTQLRYLRDLLAADGVVDGAPRPS
jgi:cephalosporin-C deacetylase